jgi:hypothetical protein
MNVIVPRTMPSSRTDRLILAAAAVWLAIQISPLWYPAPDSGAYLSIARGIAHETSLANFGRPQLYYSIGYPLLIAPLYIMEGDPFLRIALLHFVLGLAILAMVYRWARDVVPEHAAWVAALAVGTAAFSNNYRRPLSETAFMTALLAAVLVLNRVTSSRRRWLLVGLGAITTVIAVLIRPAGLALAAGFGLVMLRTVWRREWSLPAAALATFAVVAPAVIVEAEVIRSDRARAKQAGGVSYTDQVRAPGQSLAGQLGEGVRVRVQEFGRLLIPGMYKAVARPGEWLSPNMLVYLPVTIAVLCGWLRFFPERGDVFAALFPFYLALYILWPFDQGARFFTPLVSLLVVCLLSLLRGAPSAPIRRIGIGLATAHLLVAIGYWQFDDRPAAVRYNADRAEVRQLIDRIPVIDRASVAIADGSDPAAQAWATYYLDRLMLSWSAGEPPPANACWTMAPAGAPPHGYVEVATAGAFRLCRRTAQPSVATPTSASVPGSGTGATTKLSIAK